MEQTILSVIEKDCHYITYLIIFVRKVSLTARSAFVSTAELAILRLGLVVLIQIVGIRCREMLSCVN